MLGGDYCVRGAWPGETLRQLYSLENALWIRGNIDRALIEAGEDDPYYEPITFTLRALSHDDVDRLYALPVKVELDATLYCHGSPLADEETFLPEPEAGEERMLAGERDRTIFFGHSHLQFRRPGPDGTDLVNPGSVGLPLDGDQRAAWALVGDDGSIELRRTAYDVEPAIARLRELGAAWADETADWLSAAAR